LNDDKFYIRAYPSFAVDVKYVLTSSQSSTCTFSRWTWKMFYRL